MVVHSNQYSSVQCLDSDISTGLPRGKTPLQSMNRGSDRVGRGPGSPTSFLRRLPREASRGHEADESDDASLVMPALDVMVIRLTDSTDAFEKYAALVVMLGSDTAIDGAAAKEARP